MVSLRRARARVAVRLRLGHDSAADGAACARAVLHHDRLPELRGKLLEDEPMDDVGRAAGAHGDDGVDRLRRPALGRDVECSEREKQQESAFHGHLR